MTIDRLMLLDWLRPHCEPDAASVMYAKAKGDGPGWVNGQADVDRAVAAYRGGTLADETFESVTKDSRRYTISGGTRLGLVPHRDGRVARFCLDFDDHGGDGGTVHLADAVDRFLGAEAVRFTSKGGRGLHAYYAFVEPVAAEAFVEWARAWGFNRRGAAAGRGPGQGPHRRRPGRGPVHARRVV